MQQFFLLYFVIDFNPIRITFPILEIVFIVSPESRERDREGFVTFVTPLSVVCLVSLLCISRRCVSLLCTISCARRRHRLFFKLIIVYLFVAFSNLIHSLSLMVYPDVCCVLRSKQKIQLEQMDKSANKWVSCKRSPPIACDIILAISLYFAYA